VLSAPKIEHIVGKTIIAISDGKRSVQLGELSIMREPDNFTSYHDYNRFFAHLLKLHDILSKPEVSLHLANGETIRTKTQTIRAITNLPYQYWLVHLFSGVGFFVGVWIWGYRKDLLPSQLLVVGGCGYMLAAACLATYGYRELAFDPVQFRLLASINHLSNSILAYTLVILLCHYPSRLFKQPITLIGFVFCLLIWINEQLQIVSIPIHNFYLLQYLLPVGLGVFLARWQWRKHNHDPVARASIRWLFISIFLSIGLVVILYFGPTLFNEPPLLPLWLAQFVLLGLYIGFTLGVMQYGLFHVERWWFTCWIWFFAGLFVSGFDIVMVYIFNFKPQASLSLSILLTAWLYFPLRHWLWVSTVGSTRTRLEEFYPMLLESYISSNSICEFIRNWPIVLKNIYRPLLIESRTRSIPDVSIVDQGYTILIPDINDPARHWVLCGMQMGGRLFSSYEVEFIKHAIQFARNCIAWGKNRDDIAKRERARITRDLHDEVGALLLSLIYKAESAENRQLARAALAGVRATIYSLNDEVDETMQAALSTWRAQIFERLAEANITLSWDIYNLNEDFKLNARQRINLDKILSEAFSNIIKHAKPLNVVVTVEERPDGMNIVVVNDGVISDPASWKPHGGLYNMRNRANEINGTLNWKVLATVPATIELTISFAKTMPW